MLGGAFVAVFASSSAAQDRKWGVLFGYPGSAGIQWDVAEKFAVRIDGHYDRNHTTLTTGMADPPPRPSFTFFDSNFTTSQSIFIAAITETTTQSGSIAVSGLFALHARDQLKIYVAPRVGVRIVNLATRTEWDVSGIPPPLLAAITLPANQERSQTNYSPDFSAKFGAAYRLGDRFAVFGETGVGYTSGTASSTGSTLEIKQSSVGLRAGVGGILYF